MPAPRIKICGLTTAETLEAAIAARADFFGLMFYAPSPRNLSFAAAAELAVQAGQRIARVGVFVDPDDALLEHAVKSGQLNVLQLNGTAPARRAELRTRFGLPVWAVHEVAGPDSLAGLEQYSADDLLLYDAKTPKGAERPGGMGLAFDWAMLAQVRHPQRWGLAGGLSPANVAAAIAQTGARLVDCSSGVESAPGVKEPALIAAFCRAARAAQ